MNVNIVLYDEFETLDALGIANIFGMAPEHFYINYLSVNGGLVTSKQGVKVWTELLIPEEVEDILLLPGGRTATKLLCLEPKKLEIIKAAAQEADICMMAPPQRLSGRLWRCSAAWSGHPPGLAGWRPWSFRR